jgi:hypothetical protein
VSATRTYETAANRRFETMAAITLACIATALAGAAALRRSIDAGEARARQESTKYWQYYQDRTVRRHQADLARDLLSAKGSQEEAARYSAESVKREQDQQQFLDRARLWDRTVDESRSKNARIRIGQGALELALVLAALAILNRRRFLLAWAVACALLGSGVATVVMWS